MKKQIIRGVIIAVVIAFLFGSFIFIFVQRQWQGRMEIWQQLEKAENKEEFLKNYTEKSIQQLCGQIVKEAQNTQACDIFKESKTKDSCYYCFALTNKDILLCDKINQSSTMYKSCKDDIIRK